MKFKWAYGLAEDDDDFRAVETKEEALSEGAAHARDCDQEEFYIAESREVSFDDVVQNTWNGHDIVEHLLECNMDYMPEGHEEQWLAILKQEQLNDLEERVRKAIKEWLQAHGLRPTWYDLEAPRRVEIRGGQPYEA